MEFSKVGVDSEGTNEVPTDIGIKKKLLFLVDTGAACILVKSSILKKGVVLDTAGQIRISRLCVEDRKSLGTCKG